MAVEYYELTGLEIIKPSDLVLPKSLKLYSAIKQNKEYELLQTFRQVINDVTVLECLIVNVTCDQVPSINANGLYYRERLAIQISHDEGQLVNVFALRKDFPILLHQYQSRTATPARLCLYFDSEKNVSRTWTAQNFLKRIIWWIEQSSRGDLHPADQAIEGFFYETPHEIVLPWDFDVQRNNGTNFTFISRPNRPDNGINLFAVDISKKENISRDKIIDVIQLELPSIVHNQVEQDPYTFGELVDLFETKGINLIGLLKAHIVLESGLVRDYTTDSKFLVLLLHIPIKRSENSESEAITRRAFIIDCGRLQLGIDLGFLAKHLNEVINDVLSQKNLQVDTAWRNHIVSALSVTYFNTSEKLRLRSGLFNNVGPKGLLVGVGALGSAMLDLWVRSGWGEWQIVDNDYLRPHNLGRHIANAGDVGKTKTEIVEQHCNAITLGAVKVSQLFIDAVNLSDEKLKNAHEECTLVIDASTTLEYPRLISTIDGLSRHISVFITPNGNSAVLLAENSDRKIRLMTLEAQYYRGLINGSIGDHIINNNMGSFVSGTSCRDISAIMPYSKIINHASTLAEQIVSVAGKDSACIKVWNRNDVDGRTSYHELLPQPEIRLEIGDFKIYLDQGLVNKIRAIRADSFPNETGGILLGYFDFNVNSIVIVDILPAPKDSAATPVSFERGVDGTREKIHAIAALTGDMVGYIGEWHSHPPGSSSKPSKEDYYQLIFLSLGMAEDGLPAISLIVGENDLQVLMSEVV